MKCPVCADVNLVMSERQGIEIDYCPQCRGVWLDRGELDKIIERSAASLSEGRPESRDYDNRDSHKYRHKDDDDYYYKRKKRGGFLGEIFDFD